MTENDKNPAAQKSNMIAANGGEEGSFRNPQTGEFQEPSNTENAKNGKEGSEWLGGPQNGNKTPGKETEGAYQTASHSTGWEDRRTQVKPLETSQKPSSGPETTTQEGYGQTKGG